MALTSLKKKRRIQIVALTMVALMGSTVLIGTAMKDGINFFRSPSEVADNPPNPAEIFKIGGLVAEGSIEPDFGQKFFFDVTDGGATIRVHYVGNDPAPDLFSEGQGTIATGQLVDGVFNATEILAKHDETYMPKEVLDALKEQGTYVEPSPGS